MITSAEIQTIRDADHGAVLPGIDTKTGNPDSPSSLLPVAKITQKTTAPYYYAPSRNEVLVTQAGAVLSGINFGSATLRIDANNVTIKDSTFTGTTSFYAVVQRSNSGATVENCTFQGTKSPSETDAPIGSTRAITIKDNSFLDSPADSIDFCGGVVTGNYFSGTGYAPGIHPDAIQMLDSTVPTTITDNFIDETKNADAPVPPNNDVRLTGVSGKISNVTVSDNYLIGGAIAIDVENASNVSIANNAIGFDLFGPYYPGTTRLARVTGTKIVDFSNPTFTTQSLAAYQAAGLPTKNVVSVTGSGNFFGAKTAPTTILGKDFAGAHLFSGGAPTNFVAGLGRQYLFGGTGVNILTFLAIGDEGDTMTGFDPAKDVIDLSHIDANVTTPGLQHFTFIGSARFGGAAAEVRYQLDPSKHVTYVEADLASDANNLSPDFTITLGGLINLTAANFALTPQQSARDLAEYAVTPNVTSLVDSPANGDLNAGKTVALRLGFSENVTVAGGKPTLTLNDGGKATYVSGSGTKDLTFDYTVAARQNTASLAATAVNLPSDVTIRDSVGNAAILSLTGLAQHGPQIDTLAPKATSVVDSPANGDLGVGKTVALRLGFSENVTVAGGKPTLKLNDGGKATYASGSGTKDLTFDYTVAAGQNAASLAATAVNLPSGVTIRDSAGNAASLSLGGLAQHGPQIDTRQSASHATLDLAMFDYLNGRTSQAADVPPVLPQSSPDASRLTLTDSHSDSLTLAGNR